VRRTPKAKEHTMVTTHAIGGSTSPDSRARVRTRVGALLGAALLAALTFAVPAAVLASTATTTTLDVPSGTQYAPFNVTAHVRPAPQPMNGFIPVVMFAVDGGGGQPSPIDGNGDSGFQFSNLSPGVHSIVASFGPYPDWDASQSDPAQVTVGIATSTTLTSSLNPALATQNVTITASVSPASITGGTLAIVDAFDGSTIASGPVGSGTASVAVTRTFAAGTHPLTATYSGDGAYGPSSAQLSQAVQADTAVIASGGVQYATFYPFKDGYRDTDAIRQSLGEPASVVIRIYSPSRTLVRTVDLGLLGAGSHAWTWTGRNASGAILPAGTYSVVQRFTDTADNVKTVASSVTISGKKLIWTTSTITLYGSQIWGVADPGNGYVSTARSPYYRGVRLYSGSAGVAVAYKFTVHAAVQYGSTVTFRVLGRSPNGAVVAEGLWNRAYCPPVYLGCYDVKAMGPGYASWGISGSAGLHLDGRIGYGSVIVPYNGRLRIFDVAKVALVYRWAVLG
jgi:hypothetical protein